MNDIEFWFDFSSPYAYFASLDIEALAVKHGRTVTWRPLLLGRAFQATGMQSLSRTPVRGDYARHDWARLARRAAVPFCLPDVHPIISTMPSRALLWIEDFQLELVAPFAKAVFHAFYIENRDVRELTTVLSLAENVGVRSVWDLELAVTSGALKDRFRQHTEDGVRRGVFGSPFFFVEGEPFWGHDRLPLLDEWLARGGW